MNTESAPPFPTSLDHILAGLERIDLLIRASVVRARKSHNSADGFQGLYISEQEVDGLLARPAGVPPWAVDGAATDSSLRAAVETLSALLVQRAEDSERRKIPLRLVRLRRLFGLTAFDVDVIQLCLAEDLDLRYERLYAYLQDDVTKKRPSLDLILNLLCWSFPEKLEARSRFAPDAPLLRHQLITLVDDPASSRASFLARYVKLDERISAYLLGENWPDSRVAAAIRIVEPSRSLDDLIFPQALMERLHGLVPRLRPRFEPERSEQVTLCLQGPAGGGRWTVAEALCHEAGLRLLAVDGEQIVTSSSADFDAVLRLVLRECLLQDCALYWDGFGALLADEHRSLQGMFLDRLADWPGVAFLSTEKPWEPSGHQQRRSFLRIELPLPGYSERSRMWVAALNGAVDSAIDLPDVASKFRLTAGQIVDAAATAGNLAAWRSPLRPLATTSDLQEACRLHSSRRMASLALKVKPHYSWDDIVLPEDRLRQLREICAWVKYRSLIYDEWGFDSKLALGKGLNVLFSGPSGTGKTMAADILAGELALDLYKIDLSMVVSKYIGETEKNLSRIFSVAATANAILLFDEADSLFGKRTEVRDSHDRYANLEVNYLLQQMEQYEGLAILATNLRKNMDEAFLRRMHFGIDFPFPDADQRLRIWEKVWPERLPRSDNLDLAFMAERFELAGGSIRNIALTAAFLAAGESCTVDMRQLIRATEREHRKIGKVIDARDFGEYAVLGDHW